MGGSAATLGAARILADTQPEGVEVSNRSLVVNPKEEGTMCIRVSCSINWDQKWSRVAAKKQRKGWCGPGKGRDAVPLCCCNVLHSII